MTAARTAAIHPADESVTASALFAHERPDGSTARCEPSDQFAVESLRLALEHRLRLLGRAALPVVEALSVHQLSHGRLRPTPLADGAVEVTLDVFRSVSISAACATRSEPK